MYNNLCVAIIRLVLSVFYMLLRIASLSLNVKFQFRRVVNVSLFSNSSIFFSRGWEQLEVTCNPIVHHSHNLWNVEGHENERGEKEKQQCFGNNILAVSFKSTSKQHFLLECWPI